MWALAPARLAVAFFLAVLLVPISPALLLRPGRGSASLHSKHARELDESTHESGRCATSSDCNFVDFQLLDCCLARFVGHLLFLSRWRDLCVPPQCRQLRAH